MRAALQRGHIPNEGGRYEVSTVAAVEPYVYERLASLGFQVQRYGADIPYGQTHDVAISLHTDDGGDNPDGSNTRTGWSLGYWTEMHPSAQRLAGCVAEKYSKAVPWRRLRDNYTNGLHHYYGNRRFHAPTAFVIIEMGFACNPNERAYMLANAPKLGCAIADGVGRFFGKETIEMERWSNRQTWVRVELVETHVYVGKLEGQDTTEDAWLLISPFDMGAVVTVQAITDNDTKTVRHTVPLNKTRVVTASGFGLPGTVLLRVSSDKPVTVTVDRRGWA